MAKNSGIIFIGGRDRGLECLQALIKAKAEVAFIFCMKEEEHEIEKYYQQILELAKIHNISSKLTNFVKTDEDISLLNSIDPAILIVMGWRTIIPKKILDIPRFGAFAVHESLLPKYRGFAPINWAIINGEKKTGVSLFHMDEGMDSGNIVDQQATPIGSDETAYQIYQRTKQISIDLTLKNLKALVNGRANGRPQNHNNASYTCSRTPEDGQINWQVSARDIHNLVRALSFPYPGAYTSYLGKRLVIQQAMISPDQKTYVGSIPGRVILRGHGWVEVLTGDKQILRIIRVQEEDGEIVDASEIIKSVKATLGR